MNASFISHLSNIQCKSSYQQTKKKIKIISTIVEKASDKLQSPLTTKSLSKLEIKGPQLDKGHEAMKTYS